MPKAILKSKVPLTIALMQQASLWGQRRSKDPTSKVGALIYCGETGGMFMGYNGFPKGIDDEQSIWESRSITKKNGFHPIKYDFVVHAEVNAVNKALRAGIKLEESCLFCTHLPCPSCMKDVVVLNQIKLVYYTTDEYSSMTPRNRWLVDRFCKMAHINLFKINLRTHSITEELSW